MNPRLYLRWTWRDLRARWLQVVAIAVIIALGTGVYAGLRSVNGWQRRSYDASYALLNMYDLRVRLTEGSYVDANELRAALDELPHADWITAAEPRLIVPTLVEANDRQTPILVPGRIIGVDITGGGPTINRLHLMSGEPFSAQPDPASTAIVEYNFAAYYDLPAQGTIRLSGGHELRRIGAALMPEYFLVIANEIGFMDAAQFAVVVTPLETAQALAEQPGRVNDLLLTLADGADAGQLRAEIEQMIDAHFAGTGITIMTPADDPAHHALYSDLESDDRIFRLIAYLFLAGAAFGAFNLATRIVEAQRRQIGIGMALGMPRVQIALRPLLVGVQIAVLGVIFGLLLGQVIGAAMRGLMQDLLPLPVMETPFMSRVFLQAAALGVLLPIAATVYPVWRAVRVPPIDAIKSGTLIQKSSRLATLLVNIPLPGRSFTQMPLRNLLRTPRRTLLTLLGIATAITTLITLIGMLDSFLATIDTAEAEFYQNHPERMIVTLNSFYGVTSPRVTAVIERPEVGRAQSGLVLEGELRHSGKTIDVALELIDPESDFWRPTVVKGTYPTGQAGILINQKAADLLGVDVGDSLTLWHPKREGLFSIHMVESEIPVSGIHANPLGYLAYMDQSQAALMGLAGVTNVLYVEPAPGATQDEVQYALFHLPGIASVQPVSHFTEVFSDAMELLTGFMAIVAVAVTAMAFLIAFNSTSINVDERAREIATLFAFGLPIRTVLRMTVIENLVVGTLGTLVGIGLGWGLLEWMMRVELGEFMPEVSFTVTLAPLTLLIAVALGALVVALTPLLSLRKLARMNLSATLRVVE